jgi:hypothetical protein
MHRNAGLAFQHRSDVAGDGRAARPDGCGSAVELRDTKTPDVFLVSRLKRKHEALLGSCNYRRLTLAVYENCRPYNYGPYDSGAVAEMPRSQRAMPGARLRLSGQIVRPENVFENGC